MDHLKSEIKELQEQIAVLTAERDFFKKAFAITEEKARNSVKEMKNITDDAKYNELTSKLRGMLECPVCMEVPTSGPVHVCPNGHFVCSTCKEANCPTCRTKMFRGKSLLAVNVIENIEHKCKHGDCEELLHVKDFQSHFETCSKNPSNRIVLCPAPNQLCGKEMELSKIFDHIMSECQGSWNNAMCKALWNVNIGMQWNIKKMILPDVSMAVKGFAVNVEGSHFYINVMKCPTYVVVSIQLLGNNVECEKFAVELSVHSVDDEAITGSYVQKLSCKPLPVDLEQELKKVDGLMIGSRQIEKIAGERVNGHFPISITLTISKS